MTYSTENRQRNCKLALQVMLQLLDDNEISETVFNSDGPEFTDTIRTTWTELFDAKWVEKTEVDGRYRLTGFGWLQALKITGELKREEFRKRLETTFASMKSYVKGRRASAEVRLRDLAAKAGVPEGWLFNVIESRLIEEFHGRKGPHWDKRMVVIPAEFDMVSLDLDALLSGEAENRIAELQADLDEATEQLKQYRCPYCGSALSLSGPVPLSEHDEGYFESFQCGYSRIDGFEQSLCPSDPKFPTLDDFELMTVKQGEAWICHAVAKTTNARKIQLLSSSGKTEEEARRRVVERYKYIKRRA